MPRIPTYDAQVGLNPDTRGMPRVALSTAAQEAEAKQGAQVQALGREIGQDVPAMLERIRTQHEERERFNASVQESGRAADMESIVAKAKESMAPDGSDFIAKTMPELDRAAEARFNAMSPAEAEKRRAKYYQGGERTSWETQLATTERKQAASYSAGQIQSDLETGLGEIAKNPAAAASVRERLAEKIQNAPGFSRAERAVYAETTTRTLAKAEAGRLFAADPEGAARVLGVSANPDAPASAAGLRLKSGEALSGGDVQPGALKLAQTLQATMPGLSQFTALNDGYHKGTASHHASGLAMDFVIKDPGQSGAAAEQARQTMLAAGLKDSDIQVIDEYKNPSPRSTGGHIHVAFRSADAAARFATASGGDKATAGDTTGSTGSAPTPPDARFASLTFADRQNIVAQARTARTALDQRERGTLKNAITDDLASIERTGEPLATLTPERVATTFGPEAAQEWQAERSRRQRIYSATNGIELLPETEINQRIANLAPAPGSEGFARDDQVYAQARQKADKVIEARRADPAAAVADMPAVQEADRAAPRTGTGAQQTKTPDGAQSYIRARLTAQEQLGIPEPMALTKAEAKPIARHLRQIGEDPERVAEYVGSLQKTYGDLADEVLISAIQHERVGRDLAQSATDVLNKVAKGQPPSVADARNLENHGDVEKLDNAVKGKPGSSLEMQGAASGADLMALVQRRQDPRVVQEFDMTYGPGASARVLKEYDRRRARPTASIAAVPQPGAANVGR